MTASSSGPVTLRHVAEEAGVHVSTVSRALDPERRHLISGDIVARVEAVARRIGWRNNLAAVSLRKRRSMAIGVLVPDLVSPVTARIMQGAEAAIVRRGFFPLVVSLQAADSPRAVIERLLAQRVDGVVVMTEPEDDAIVRSLVKAGVPAVLTARADASGQLSAVTGDRDAAAELAIDHLHALGHRRIALLAGPQGQPNGQQRLRAAQQALARHALVADRVAIADAFTRDGGLRATLQLLDDGARGTGARPGFSAIFAGNDLLAFGAYEALRRRGLAIARDVSVVGQNDMLLADIASPPLTTVRMQHHEMGRQAGQLVIDQIEARGLPDATPLAPRAITLAPELVIRESTDRPPQETP